MALVEQDHDVPANELEKRDAEGEGNGVVPAGHKRSLSGTILSRFFARSSHESTAAKQKANGIPEADQSIPGGEAPKKRATAMASALKDSTGRRRKGSLRKTAMLGTRMKLENRQRRDSLTRSSSLRKTNVDVPPQDPVRKTTTAFRPDAPPRKHNLDTSTAGPSFSSTQWELAVVGDHFPQQTVPVMPTTEASRQNSLASTTTTETSEDGITIPATAQVLLQAPKLRPSVSSTSTSDSYLYPTEPKRSQIKRTGSPLAASSVPQIPASAIPPPHSYSTTEFWGWVILLTTWLTFVVGMGSCLDIWSWAWDVGETPYAPPELEDDPTLPITGYYPCLLVLTGVMAWVWVVVAWVGIKWFRHAKVVGEEGVT